MVKDDFWSKPRDDFDNVEALANQKKIPIANKADAAQSLQIPESLFEKGVTVGIHLEDEEQPTVSD